MASKHDQLSHRFYQNVKSFIREVLCNENIGPDDFIEGTQRIEFFGELIEKENQISPREADIGGTSYEEALLARIAERTDLGTLILMGGLGAGKSTTIRYVLHLLKLRRDSLRIVKCAEHCEMCTRQPLYVDCISIERDIDVTGAIAAVTQKIRDTVYEQIIHEWFARHGIPSNVLDEGPVTQAMRRLIITNDLRIWAEHERLPNLDLPAPPELDAHTKILSLRPDEATLSGLMDRFEGHLVRLDGWLGRMHNNQKDNIDFTSVLLRFYLSKCPPQNPQNFLVIDNLDQLPTRHIEEIAKLAHKLSAVDRSFLVIVPLRPSSILTPGHIRTTEVWYHYGPNCYIMLLRRLEKYVLERSRSSLMTSGSKQSLFSVAQPTEEELRFFLIATYLYAKILASRDGGEVKIHPDHKDLRAVRVPEVTANNISSTLGALVGTCARYANEQMLRYFQSIYHDSDAIFDTIGRMSAGGAKTRVTIPYKLIMDTIMFDSSSDVPVSEHIANLFSPTRRGANDRLPSLVKIRILKFLRRWKRATVRDVVRFLSLYGIPAEVAIEGLNSLHDKDRLLLWFSENHELKSETQDGDQQVVISEHGVSYLEYVLGDFEYIWACAANMHGRKYRDAIFVVRLREYESLVTALGETEWKQIAFRRCLGNYIRPQVGAAEYGELTTLSIIYKSISRALRSSESILKRRPSEDAGESIFETQQLIERLCELMQVWQARYVLCFHGEGYRNIYSIWRREAREALERVVPYLDLKGAGAALVSASLKELAIDSWEEPRLDFRWGRIALDEDYVTQAARFLRGFLPFPTEWLKSADKNIALKIQLERFTDSELRLGALLGLSLPCYREVEEALADVLKNIHYLIVQIENAGVATGTDLYKTMLRERDSVSSYLENLRSSVIADSPPCTAIQMSERKERFNNIMAIYQGLATRFSPEPVLLHLKVSWH